MDKLRDYLNNMSVNEQKDFAEKCGTTIGYLRKKLSDRKYKLGERICISIEENSKGEVICEHLRPDINWSVLRNNIFNTKINGKRD